MPLHRTRKARTGSRLWREWCFWKAALRHFRVRLGFLLAVLLAGGLLFKYLEPEKNHTLAEAAYYTWSLIFGEPPESFPRHPVLQVLFFLVPVIGLTVIIEGMVDLALLVRDRRRNERIWSEMMTSVLKNHVVLVGAGRLGYRTFLQLRQMGEDVVIIERDANNQFLEAIRQDGAPLFIGDGRREQLLSEAAITRAKSIIVATNDDLANLEIALDARRLAPNIRIVMRVFDQNMADKICDGFNIHIAMSASALSAPAFAAAAVEPSIVGSMLVDGRLVVMQRWQVRLDGPMCGKTVGDILTRYGFSIMEWRRPGQRPVLFPPAETRLDEDDKIVLQGLFENISVLRAASAEVQAAGDKKP